MHTGIYLDTRLHVIDTQANDSYRHAYPSISPVINTTDLWIGRIDYLGFWCGIGFAQESQE